MKARSWVAALFGSLSLVAFSGCGDGNPGGAPDTSEPRRLTFNQDIAPLVFEQCTPCHRPGQQTPLPLLNYEDVRRRSGQLLVSLLRRTMPPWLPDPASNAFLNAKLLPPDQIAMFQQWVDDGEPEGEPAPPAVPDFSDRWRLGEPDMIVRPPQPYTLIAEGPEVVRNLVIPAPVSSVRYVRAMEFRPGNSRILRHAVVGIDRTPRARTLDASDREPGYPGMVFDHLAGPRDRLNVWVPGSAPWVEPDGMAWRVEPGDDLVVSLRLRPAGTPESIQPSIALYFSEAPPVRDPLLLKLEAKAINIPAGSSDHLVTDRYVLPVSLQILTIYPHAHDLAREIQATATLPDGSTKRLLWIEEWDARWAEQYRYAQPVDLPSGSTIEMQYRYDNSEANMRNPHYPPRRVQWGVQLFDEMGLLWLQVLTHDPADADILLEDYQRRRPTP